VYTIEVPPIGEGQTLGITGLGSRELDSEGEEAIGDVGTDDGGGGATTTAAQVVPAVQEGLQGNGMVKSWSKDFCLHLSVLQA
jgi:hypothetical protein